MKMLMLSCALVALATAAQAQNVPTELRSLQRADVSRTFTQIQEYNRLIAVANAHHHDASRERVKLALAIPVGAALMYFGLPVVIDQYSVLSGDGDETLDESEEITFSTIALIGGISATGLGFGLIAGSPDSIIGARRYKQMEQEAISSARRIFPNLDPRR